MFPIPHFSAAQNDPRKVSAKLRKDRYDVLVYGVVKLIVSLLGVKNYIIKFFTAHSGDLIDILNAYLG